MTEPEPVAMINRKNVRVLADGCDYCSRSLVLCDAMAGCCPTCQHPPAPDAA